MPQRFKNFVTVHSHPNSLDSGSTPESFAEREVDLETGALVCTDHGTLQASHQIYSLAKERALTPIVGCEAYFRDELCPILSANGYAKNEMGGWIDAPKYSHITLHALDYAAYKCMVRLISRADLRLEADKEMMEPAHRKMGSERKALFRWADLEELGTHNVTATSSCMAGMCKRHILDNDDPKTAIQYLERLKSTFKPGNFYAELNPHNTSHNWIQGVFVTMADGTVHRLYDGKVVMTDAGEIRAGQLAKDWALGKHHILKSIKDRSKWREMPEAQISRVEAREGFERNQCKPWSPDGDYEAALNRFMFIQAKKRQIPVVIGCDAHYATPESAIVQDVRLAQNGPWRFYTGGQYNTYHRLSSDEAWTHFQSIPGVTEKEFESWIANSHDWASRFKDFKFESTPSLPTKFYEEEYKRRPWYVAGKADNSVRYTMELIRKHGRMKWDDPKYVKRLRQEIELLHGNGTIDLLPYFMIDEDVVSQYEKAELLTGPGRGCLTGNALVVTERGYKTLSEVQVGDRVLTHTGKFQAVRNTMSYEIDEELLELRTTYKYTPFALTKEHEVFGFKRTRIAGKRKEWEKGKVRTFEKETPTPSWTRADSLVVGDQIWTPAIPYDPKKLGTVDLLQHLAENEYLRATDDCIEFNIVKTDGKRSFPGVSNRFVLDIRNGVNPTFMTKNGRVATRTKRAWLAIMSILAARNLTLERWREDAKRTVSCRRYVDLDSAQWSYFLGRWVGDGWIKSKDHSSFVGVAFHSDDVDGIAKIKAIAGPYCTSVAERKHKTKNLVQLIMYGKPLVRMLRALFPGYKDTSFTKYLGPTLSYAPELLKSCVEGLIDSDGSEECGNGKVRTCIDSTSPVLIEEARQALARLGVPASVYRQAPRVSGKYKCKEAFKMRFKWTNANAAGYWCDVLEVKNLHVAGRVYDLEVENDSSYVTSEFTVHNSAAGALITFLLGITHVDPLRYNLSLDRFLTKDRIASGKLPDIDQDLSSRDLLTGGVSYLEIEMEDGTKKIVPATSTVSTEEGEVTVQEAFDRGLDVQGWA